MDNGNLIFPPFQASDYKQEVHAGTYRCTADNGHGREASKTVEVAVEYRYVVYLAPMVL